MEMYILKPISNAIRNIHTTSENTRWHIVPLTDNMMVDMDEARRVRITAERTLIIPVYAFLYHRANYGKLRYDFAFAYMDEFRYAQTGLYLHRNTEDVIRAFFQNFGMDSFRVQSTSNNYFRYYGSIYNANNIIHTVDEGLMVAHDYELYTDNEGNYYFNEDNVPDEERDESMYDENGDIKYVSEYHEDKNNYEINFNNGIDPKTQRQYEFFVGCEIEKEDMEIKESMTWKDFKYELPYFRKERDGSLDELAGYEFITPKMPLDVDAIEKMFNENNTIRQHVNADYDYKTCGGHIHVSSPNLRGEEMYDRINGYLPILAALYPTRATAFYCKMLGKDWMKFSNEKRQAVRIFNNRIEIRIFPAVKNVRNLVWRLRLIEIMVNNPATELSEVNMDVLKPLLESIHDTPQKTADFYDRIQAWNKKTHFATDRQYPSAYNANVPAEEYDDADCDEDYNF